MENMREYWAREAEMMRDKSAILGTTSLYNSPNQNNSANSVGTISFAPEFEGGVGAELQKLANLTSLYKAYLIELDKQSTYDTYIFSFPSMITYDAGPASVVNFDTKGYAEGVGTKGRTFLISNEQDFKLQTGGAADPDNRYKLNFVKLESIKPSFDNKKKVILIGLARQFLNPSAFPLDKTHFENLQKNVPNEAHNRWWDTAKLDGTQTLIHELIAHGINHIKNKKKTAKEEHFAYHGVKDDSSPSVRDVLTDEKKYKNTVMLKAIREIQLAIQQLYYVKK